MSFNIFKFHPSIATNIVASGYTNPTPIQSKAIPPILVGQDVLGLAQTGTGKTAAFVLPILQRLITGKGRKEKAVIIAPTRELAEQIHETIIGFTRGIALSSVAVYGGVSKQPQISAIRNGADIIIACPGRLLDILNEKGITLRDVKTLVLDEADHMFDKGFLPDIRRIIKQLPKNRQSLVFSATMPKEIRQLIGEILVNPCTVQIDHVLPAATISHARINVVKPQKSTLLKTLLKRQDITRTVVFTRTKHKAKSLAIQLQKMGLKATSLQGNLSQPQRRRAMDGFRDGSFTVLVATDIAARGLDISEVSHVINFDIPDTVETYTHRTGRTGRATRSGTAITFATKDELGTIANIEKKLGLKMQLDQVDLPPTSNNPGTMQNNRADSGGNSSRRKKSARKTPGKKARGRVASFDFGVN